MDTQLSKMAGMVTHWMVEDLALGKQFDDTDDDSQIIDDDEEAQQKRFLKIMRNLPHYDPHDHMLQALNMNFTNESLSKEDTTFGAYLQTQCLDYDNVCSVLTKLLSIEDVSNMKLYAQLIQPNVTLTKVHKLCYNFMLVADTEFNPEDVLAPYLDEVVLVPMQSLLVEPLPIHPIMALLPHKHEDLYLKDPMRRQVACLVQFTRNNVQILFKPNEFPGDEILSQPFYVIIRSRRTPIRFMYRAMQLLQENPAVRRYLFPIKSPLAVIPADYELPDLELLNANIASNAEQLQAVKHIVNGPNPQAPYIVFGPPGTGKTTTIVEAILQLRLLQPRSRILVAAGSNSACDTIALKICEYFAGNQRLQNQIVDRARKSPLVTQDVEPFNQIIRLFSRSIFAKGLTSVHPLLLCNSNCSRRTYEHLGVNTLRKFGIIVATLCTVGRLVTTNLGKFNFFTHVFIDEAGASMEPETLVGIMGIKQNDKCHVILSGDHKQLSAIITSYRAATLGLKYSLMERLLRSDLYALSPNGNYDQTLQTRLRRNYRSHPEIVELFNTLYYNGKLIPKAPPSEVNLAANWNLLPNPKFPIVFQATHGVTQRELQSTSSINALEAQVLIWYVKHLLQNGLGGGVRVNQQDIGIIAPYLGQCRLIVDLLRGQGYLNVEVGSVEKYQGREKAIIIATLVRSFSNMGFMRNPRRINVLLSRAKSLMILIGNPVTLRHHRDFLYIINKCKLHGNYLFKKKDGYRRPNFLNDVEDSEEDGFNDEFIPWYAEMPTDISIPIPKIQLPSNTIEVSSSDETESSEDISSSTNDSSSSSSNIQLSIDMDNLSLRNGGGILSINTHCGLSVSFFPKQNLMQLQNHSKDTFFFTHVFIDEAGASMEPETLVGIMGIKQNDKCHVILSGDHKQLSAIITSYRAATLGLKYSLMERLLRSDLYALSPNGNYDQTLQTRLRRNYRSHPEIVELFNTLYYNGKLIPKAPPSEVNLAANWNLLPNPKFPIVFQATHGVTQRELQSTSSINALEAQVLIWYVKHLLQNGLGGGVRVNQQDIGIIAPYLGQCRLIVDLLRGQGYLNVEVGSVEKYQGREKAIIIATLVRSFSNMGFMRNPRRINVLLSRAKSLMILIGNPVTLRHHRDFLYIINKCKLHGNYLFKKKDGYRRPNFLNDVEDSEEDGFNDEFIPWYAEMPTDISIPIPKIQLPSNTIEVSSSDETESSEDISSSTNDSSSSSSNIQLSIDMDNLSLRNGGGILSINTHCGLSVSFFPKQNLMQLQ